MEINSPEILALKNKVRIAGEEFDIAIAFHEIWKIATYDQNLLQRMGTSYATNAFRAVRTALRREMLLALMRLWDTDKRAISLPNIARSLEDTRIIDALARDLEGYWQGVDADAEADTETREAIKISESRYGKYQSQKMRESARKTIEIIRKYEPEGTGHQFFRALRGLRDERLAHRQLKDAKIASDFPGEFDKMVSDFYDDMEEVIKLLHLVVEASDYRPEESAAIERRYAEFFWAPVCGERTEGHPNYKPLPTPRPIKEV